MAASSRSHRFCRRLAAAAAVVPTTLVLACASCGKGASPPQDATAQKAPRLTRDTLHLFAFGRVKGTIAPCGCTTEPLGGLAYAFGHMESVSDPDSRLVVEPGSFLYPDPEDPEAPTDAPSWEQAHKRAAILHDRFDDLGPALVSGIGPLDVGSPQHEAALNQYPLPRVLSNAKALPPGTKPYRLTTLRAGNRNVSVGVTGVTDPALGQDTLGPLTNPVAAVKSTVADMRSAGAEIAIALVHGPREQAEVIAREVQGLDFAVVGHVEGTENQRIGAPVTRVGDTFVIQPGEQLQTMTHVTLSVASGVPLGSAAKWNLQESRASQADELQRLQARVKKFEQDPTADAAYLDRLRSERDALEAKLKAGTAVADPVSILVEQIKITCHREVDERAKQALVGYDAWVAKENAKRFAGVSAPEVDKGQSGYAGIEECEMCHDEAVVFWNETVHAGAYDTLVNGNKQFDLSCVGCHVTGFRKPGGSEVVENEGLTAVQCEVCHGPGQAHADDPEKGGKAQFIERHSPVSVCLQCHTPEHSDTFDYQAYMRDILGPGHGAPARAALGEGPTGRELRAAGLAKAGGTCKKNM